MSRLLTIWIFYATIMGFAAGGTFVASYLTPSPQHVSSSSTEDASTDQHSKEKSDEALARYTWWLTIFTGVMAFATVGLGIATVGLYVTGEKQIGIAVRAANAADQSARAMIGLELPVIRMTPDKITSTEQMVGGEMIVSYWVSHVVFANFGQTRAIPVEIRYGMTCGESLPQEPIYRDSDSFLPDTAFEPPPPRPDPHVTPLRRLSNCSVVVPIGVLDKVKDRKIGLWFYCCLVYDDFMNERREVARCWYLIDNSRGLAWRPDDTPAYNRKS